MKFKPWLESTEEQYSNEMTGKLCSWIKMNGRKPRTEPAPILSGSPTAGSRVSYNMDLEETKLGNFLKYKISSGQIYPSDQAILQKHQIEGLFETRKEDRRRENNFKNIQKLAEYYRRTGRIGRYPQKKDSDPESKSLLNWLSYKRSVRRGTTTGRPHYEGEKEFGIELGLPEDWLDHDHNQEDEKRNRTNIEMLAEFYKKNGRYPGRADPQIVYLSNWLISKRMARKGRSRVKIYDGDREFGIELGLPEDWLDRDRNQEDEKRSRKNIERLAEFYKKTGRYPSRSADKAEPQLVSLDNWLQHKRRAIRGLGALRVYDGDREFGIELGLPEDWLDRGDRNQEGEKRSRKNIERLAEFYKKTGRYPSRSADKAEPQLVSLDNWFLHKRRATRGLGTLRVYDGDREFGIELGLPEDWLDYRGK